MEVGLAWNEILARFAVCEDEVSSGVTATLSGQYAYWSNTQANVLLTASSTAFGNYDMELTASVGPSGQTFAPAPQATSAQSNRQGTAVVGCGDERDTLIQEYRDYSVNLSPTCGSFTNSAQSEYFSYAELTVLSPASWAIIGQPLIIAKSSGYGLDRWREMLGAAQITNSVYRAPAAVDGAAQSRHMYGDAVDLRNQTRTEAEYTAKASSAKGDPNNLTIPHAQADFVEALSGPCGIGCVHADWRNH
jgi:hypothetical protein